jgi:hypothetical protein
MKTGRITGIGRPVDLGYPTNRAIAAVAVAVTVGGSVLEWLTGAGGLQGAAWGVGAGLAVFLAWALCRELDPDHELSAFVAAGLALLGLFFGTADLGALLWFIVVARVLNRSTGLTATILDSLAVVGLGGWLVVQRGAWVYGLVSAVTLALDGGLASPNRKQWVFAGGALLATALWAGLTGSWWGGEGLSVGAVVAVLAMSVVFVPVIAASGAPSTVGDQTGERLQAIRVRAAQAAALLAGILMGLWAGRAGIVALMPLWAAVVGAALYRVFVCYLAPRLSGRRETGPGGE